VYTRAACGQNILKVPEACKLDIGFLLRAPGVQSSCKIHLNGEAWSEIFLEDLIDLAAAAREVCILRCDLPPLGQRARQALAGISA
jgi:hypothetical protein